jgi:hypothetical protein
MYMRTAYNIYIYMYVYIHIHIHTYTYAHTYTYIKQWGLNAHFWACHAHFLGLWRQ